MYKNIYLKIVALWATILNMPHPLARGHGNFINSPSIQNKLVKTILAITGLLKCAPEKHCIE